jgi:integrase
MLDHIERKLHPERVPTRKETPTYHEWFHGRFWNEWVIGERNKPSEQIAKKSIYKQHLGPAFGELHVHEIGVEQIQQLRAKLVKAKLGDKRINNIMAVLSKSLRYAAEVELIERAPKIRLRKVDRGEIEAWTFEEYALLLEGAREESPWWYAAACLAGEAGLRIGEVRALKWREDVDLESGFLTVSRQAGNGHEGTPKGRTRRTVPMTSTLVAALEALPVDEDVRDLRGRPVREGYVLHNGDKDDPENETEKNTPMRDAQTSHAIYRICGNAELDDHGWHKLRHSFGTHAARFGVNPWQLMEWMGHKRIDETMGYVHIAERHRSIPPELVAAGMNEVDPNRRVLAMLGARGKAVAKSTAVKTGSVTKSVR